MKPVKATFEPVDYVVFSVLLMVSAAVGIYFAVQEHRNKSKCEETTTDYLMAGRSMSYGQCVPLNNGFINFKPTTGLIKCDFGFICAFIQKFLNEHFYCNLNLLLKAFQS